MGKAFRTCTCRFSSYYQRSIEWFDFLAYAFKIENEPPFAGSI